MSTHLGTHFDAPYHFDGNGKKSSNLILIYISALLL
ncbi:MULTISPECIES: cyclase family protein [Peribacillus]|nr:MULTISPECIES: cyclase family protein [Peribacillus]